MTANRLLQILINVKFLLRLLKMDVYNPMKEFIAYLIKNLVDQPDAVDVQIIDGRTIAMTVGARFGRRVRLELVN